MKAYSRLRLRFNGRLKCTATLVMCGDVCGRIEVM